MSRIVWLASYPKSGNTWLRALLTNYRRDDGTATINALDGGTAGLWRSTVDDCLGLDSSLLALPDLQRCRPRVYERLARESSDDPLLIKVHDAYRMHEGDPSPFFTPAARGAIYLVRHPLDLVVSYAHHRNKSVDDTVAAMADENAFMDGTHSPGDTLPQFVSSWSRHVSSWLEQRDIAIELVKYEDLIAEPCATLTRVLNCLGWVIDRARVSRAVAASAFDELQAQEARDGFREKPPASPSFFREGRAGNWRRWLNAVQVDRMLAAQSSGVARLGYGEFLT